MHRQILDAPADYIEDSTTLFAGLKAGGVGVWRWTVDTARLEWSANLETVHHLPRGSFDGTISSFQADVHPDDAERVWHLIEHTLETGEPYRITYRTRGTEDADPLWIEASGRLIENEDGSRFLTGVCMNVTERVTAERELEQRLRQQKAVEAFGSFAFLEPDLAAVLDRACEIAAQVLDVPLTKILRFAGSGDHLVLTAGRGWQDGLVGSAAVGIDRQSQAGYTLSCKEPVVVENLATETRFNGPTLLHDHRVRSGMSVTIPGSTSRPFGVFGIHDTRSRRFTSADSEFLTSMATIVANSARHHEAAEHRMLLMREMAHRAGNMLQLVSTIANQTFAGDADIERARHAFNDRLGSLSRANYIVAQGGWTSTRLRSLLEEALKHHHQRICHDGLDVLLPPELCFDLGLIMHELATNSVKYGSLGVAGGADQVRLDWAVEIVDAHRHKLILNWCDPRNSETDPATPRIGFGSRLLEALITQKWQGNLSALRSPGYSLRVEMYFAPVH